MQTTKKTAPAQSQNEQALRTMPQMLAPATVDLQTPPKLMLLFLKKWVIENEIMHIEIFDKERQSFDYEVSHIVPQNIEYSQLIN